jgi:hypothetical protein
MRERTPAARSGRGLAELLALSAIVGRIDPAAWPQARAIGRDVGRLAREAAELGRLEKFPEIFPDSRNNLLLSTIIHID